jgi:DNA-binding NarL/FixJ family response regulator
MIELVRQHGPTWIWQATALALYTGQRQGDVLEMSWAAVKDGMIEVQQEKTGKTLSIAAHQQLLSVLQMLCHGLLNKQIAHKLDVHETTIKAHACRSSSVACIR